MEMTGEQRIPASQAETWQALNDPAVLRECVPGCEAIDRVTAGGAASVVRRPS